MKVFIKILICFASDKFYNLYTAYYQIFPSPAKQFQQSNLNYTRNWLHVTYSNIFQNNSLVAGLALYLSKSDVLNMLLLPAIILDFITDRGKLILIYSLFVGLLSRRDDNNKLQQFYFERTPKRVFWVFVQSKTIVLYYYFCG